MDLGFSSSPNIRYVSPSSRSAMLMEEADMLCHSLKRDMDKIHKLLRKYHVHYSVPTQIERGVGAMRFASKTFCDVLHELLQPLLEAQPEDIGMDSASEDDGFGSVDPEMPALEPLTFDDVTKDKEEGEERYICPSCISKKQSPNLTTASSSSANCRNTAGELSRTSGNVSQASSVGGLAKCFDHLSFKNHKKNSGRRGKH